MNRLSRRRVIAFGLFGVGALLVAATASADLRIRTYQDIFGPGSSRLYWSYTYHYQALKGVGQCRGALAQAANFIGPNYTSPAAPFNGLHWTMANTRQGATDYPGPPFGFNCSMPLPMGCPGCNVIDHVPLPGYLGLNAFDRFVAGVGVVTDAAGAMTVSSYGFTLGAVRLGGTGLQTNSLADSAYARDSISVKITKHVVGTTPTVTLSNFAGELRNNPGPDNADISNTYFIAVYPDSFAANADEHNQGNGALFYGRVFISPAGTLLSGGFLPGDFTTTRDADDADAVVPRPGLVKNVAVPNLTAAVVSIVIDPATLRPASTTTTTVPGLPGVGVLIAAILLLASGLWFVQRRRSANRA